MPRIAVLALLAASGCYEHHTRNTLGDADASTDASAPPDTGRQDAGPAISACAAALESGRPGSPCDFEGSFCVGVDACCSQSASCIDGILTIGDSWRCREPITTRCDFPAEAMVQGTTPLGPVAFDRVLGSFSHAFAVDLELVFLSAGDEAATCGESRMGAFLLPVTFELASYVGLHEVPITVTIRGRRASAPATIEIVESRLGGSLLRGTVKVMTPGWALEGEFLARECPELDRSGP